MEKKKIVCQYCGKIFNKALSLNGHLSHCKKYYSYLGKEQFLIDLESRRTVNSQKTQKKNNAEKEQQALEQWISEKHTCERCGKIMTEKLGSGRFCSVSCQHIRVYTEEQKKKISETANTIGKYKGIETCKKRYYKNPKRCRFCGSIIPYEKRTHKTCSEECLLNLQQNFGSGPHLRGWYKGYYCQSSWELAYVIFNLENNIPFIRNQDRFDYIYEGKVKHYFPDFYLTETKEYVEIKGYLDTKSISKYDQFPKDQKLLLLCADEMKPILKYVKDKYGKNFTYLYE